MSTTRPWSPSTFAPRSVSDVGRDLLNLHTQGEQRRFGTGWSMDDSCGMVGVGELALWVARAGVGKSTTYLNVIRNTPHVPTLIVNMEMTATRQLEWLLPMTFDLEAHARDIEEVLRDPEDRRYEELAYYLSELGEVYASLNFARPETPTVEDIETLLEDVEDSTGVHVQRVFIDHIGLMRGAKEYQGFTQTTAGLHSLAMRRECAINVLQQDTRGGGDAGRNDGHLPLTLSSGEYGGEADADWKFGIYRPDRNPKFKKRFEQYADPTDFYRVQDELRAVEGITILQTLKNRPFADLNEAGIQLKYDHHSRRLSELGTY